MSVKKKLAAALASAIALGASVVGTWSGASGETGKTSPSNSTNDAGETLLLVVGDVVDPAIAPARLSELNARFGDVQGFYADATAAYDVIGALLKTSADLKETLCLDAREMLDGGCVLGELVRTVQPVALTFVELDALGSDATAILCRIAGAGCGLDRITRLLGDDRALPADATVIASGFRTKRGAEEFLELARAVGVTDLVTLQVRKLGGMDVGLGQEPAPDGSGPLTAPLVNQEQYQR